MGIKVGDKFKGTSIEDLNPGTIIKILKSSTEEDVDFGKITEGDLFVVCNYNEANYFATENSYSAEMISVAVNLKTGWSLWLNENFSVDFEIMKLPG